MRKVRLQLEALAIESFDTTHVEAPRGTVLAHDRTEACTNTCEESCFETGCTCFPGCSGHISCGGGSCVGCPGTEDSCGTCPNETCVYEECGG